MKYIAVKIMYVKKEYTELYRELELLENHGIYITLEGEPVSALQVVQAHMLKEEGTYMRDYLLDEKGHLEVVVFNDVSLNAYGMKRKNR